jgi:hypothetical protein
LGVGGLGEGGLGVRGLGVITIENCALFSGVITIGAFKVKKGAPFIIALPMPFVPKP